MLGAVSDTKWPSQRLVSNGHTEAYDHRTYSENSDPGIDFVVAVGS